MAQDTRAGQGAGVHSPIFFQRRGSHGPRVERLGPEAGPATKCRDMWVRLITLQDSFGISI